MLQIFISWSGERSRQMANCLSTWLPRVIQNCRTWISDRDIEKGERWLDRIGTNLAKNDFGIICTTPENYSAPWLLFEAGALSKSIGTSRVCPLLLGMNPEDLNGPLQHFQATITDKNDILKLIETINTHLGILRLDKEILLDSFQRFWPDLEAQMNQIAKIPLPGSEFSINRVVEAFAKHGLPSPTVGSEAHFISGYESHGLYSTVMELATNRLFIVGRKNRKLFDKEHEDFMESLPEKLAKGLDFRVLFLDPEAPEHVIKIAHKDDDFQDQLRHSINYAMGVFRKYGIDSNKVCRKYSTVRVASIIAIDDAVLYSPVRLSTNGRAEKLTKAPFTIINASTPFARDVCDSFLKLWNSGRPI